MGWKYAIKKYKFLDDTIYEITELCGEYGYSASPLRLVGESVDSVIEQLELMLKDLKENLEIIEVDSEDQE